MKETNKKICPYCENKKTYDTGSRTSLVAQDIGPDGKYQMPTIPIYRCNGCGEHFIYIGHKTED